MIDASLFDNSNHSKIEIRAEKEQEKKLILIDQIIPHKGHTIWEINNKTLDIHPATFTTADLLLQNFTVLDDNTAKLEIVVKNDHSYVSALNKKSALKKFKKGQTGTKIMGTQELKLW